MRAFLKVACAAGIASFAALPAAARDVSIATWNLGWHMNLAEANEWIGACSQPFALNAESGLWEPATEGETKPGWDLQWGRDAKILWDISLRPPCDVYQANFKIVPVTPEAYRKRVEQIRAYLTSNLDADILAFQEVSGEQAVREVLPNNGADYAICAFSGFKVQRLVIAAKTSVGQMRDCSVFEPLSLPDSPASEQPRPGISSRLDIDGSTLVVMSVHLKSSCVSPLEGGSDNPRGQLEGTNEHCQILQKQISPLERWIESSTVYPTILLGDFNRNLSHELHAIPVEKVRTDGSDPKTVIQSGARTRSIIGEVNDGEPAQSALALLDTTCPVNALSEEFCRRAKTEYLSQTELRPLARWENLGCRNPVGLDHVLVSQSLLPNSNSHKVPLGRLGGTRPVTDEFPDPLLALSDHCPVKFVIDLP